MKKLILLLMVGSLFAQDVYPNFSTPKKQLQFERKRIYVKEVSEKEMIIGGGGSQFNTLALFNDLFPDYLQQPTYTQQNLTTQYKYKYTFEVSQNNRILDEFEFLQTVGLEDEIDRILAPYKESLIQYEKEQSQYNEELDKYNKEILPIVEASRDIYKQNKMKRKKNKKKIIIGTIALAATSMSIGIANDTKCENDANCSISSDYKYIGSNASQYQTIDNISLLTFLTSLGVGTTLYILNEKKQYIENPYVFQINNPPSPPKTPNYVFKQTLSSTQITAIADSYNRQLFKDIQSN